MNESSGSQSGNKVLFMKFYLKKQSMEIFSILL